MGRNGAGKTSLLKVLGGAADPAAGLVDRSGGLGYLPQDPKLDGVDESTTGLRHVLSGRGFDETLTRIEKLRIQMEEDPSERAVSRFSRAEEQFRLDGGYSAESEALRIAAGLGLDAERLTQPIGALSGGQKRRVEISRILFAGSDVLLLDEPTNHLDSDAKEWLLGFMRSYRGALLVISHDLDLLDEAITRVLHLDRRDEGGLGTIDEYKGTYSQYLVAREKDEVRIAKAAQRQAKEVDRLQTIVDRFGAKASKATMAHSIEKRIARIEAGGVEARKADRKVAVRFPPPPPPGRTVLEGSGLAVRYGDNEVFRDVDLFVERGERLLIMGLNGAGKTSLLRVLAGERAARRGHLLHWAQRRSRLLRAGARGHPVRPHDHGAPPRAGAHRCRSDVAADRRLDGPHRRQGPSGRGHALRRREDEAGARHPRGRPPQPAAPRRAHQQPRPRLPRSPWPRACATGRAASCS